MRESDIKHSGAWTKDRSGEKTADGSARMEPAKERGERYAQHKAVVNEGMKPLNPAKPGPYDTER